MEEKNGKTGLVESAKRVKVRICDEWVEIRDTPASRVKAKCIDCSGGSKDEVKECLSADCPLYGIRPYVKENKRRSGREMTDEQKEAARERMRAMHEERKKKG